MLFVALTLAGLLATEAPPRVPVALIPAMDCGRAAIDSRPTGGPALPDRGPMIRACEDSARLSQLQSALLKAVERRALVAVSDEELFVSAGADFSRRIRACGPELSCICAASSSLPADLLLVLLASVDRNPVLLGARLIDRHACKIVGQAVTEAKPNELVPAVTQLAAGVLEKSGHPQLARIKFKLEPADAAVIAPDSMSMDLGDPTAFTGKSGKYTVTVSRDGYASQTLEVELDPAREAQQQVTLLAETSILESPWLWIGIGVVAAGAVTGGILWMNRPEVVCVVEPGGRCSP